MKNTALSLLLITSLALPIGVNANPPPPAPRTQNTGHQMIPEGERRSLLCRIALGPRTQQRSESRLRGSTLIPHQALQGGGVAYDVVEMLEFQSGVLNSSWFLEALKNQLTSYGLVLPRYSHTSTDDKVTTNMAAVLESFKVLPIIVDEHGADLANTLWTKLKRDLRIQEATLETSQLGALALQMKVSPDQVRSLREFIISNLYREDEFIDAIHISLGKGTLLVQNRVHQLAHRSHHLSGVTIATTATYAAGSISWFFYSLVEYIGNVRFAREIFPDADVRWFESYKIDRVGGRLDLDNMSRQTLDTIRYSDWSSMPLHDDLYINVPEWSALFAATGVLLANRYLPRFYRNSRLYVSIMRERMLRQYRNFLNRNPVQITNDGAVIDGEATEIIDLGDGSNPAPQLVINRISFESLDDLQNLTGQVSAISTEPDASDLTNSVRMIDRDVSHANAALIAAYSKDMANWMVLAEYYKRRIAGVLQDRSVTGAEFGTYVREYRDRLAELNRRVERYETILFAVEAKVKEMIESLEALKDDKDRVRGMLLTDDREGRNLQRAIGEIEEAIARLRFLYEGNIQTEQATLDTSFETIRNENQDLVALERALEQASLAAAISDSVRQQMHPILIALTSRRVQDASMDPPAQD